MLCFENAKGEFIMFTKKNHLMLSLVALLSLSLLSTASTVGTTARAESAPHTFTAYLSEVQLHGDKVTFLADDIDWYEGEEADRIFAEYEPEAYAELGGTPDGYYIVNDSETLLPYSLSADADIRVQIFDLTGQLEDVDLIPDQSVTAEAFANAFQSDEVVDMTWFPYHITVEDGEIVSVVQQYLP